jgi:hypothetical protein
VDHYNNIRLNSAIGYITPKDMFAGRQAAIHAERDRKLEEARKQRQIRRQQGEVARVLPGFRYGWNESSSAQAQRRLSKHPKHPRPQPSLAAFFCRVFSVGAK